MQSLLDNKPLSVIVLAIAFVALVLPFDSFRGAARNKLAAFFFGTRGISQGSLDQPLGPREAMQFNFEVLK